MFVLGFFSSPESFGGFLKLLLVPHIVYTLLRKQKLITPESKVGTSDPRLLKDTECSCTAKRHCANGDFYPFSWYFLNLVQFLGMT